MRFFCRGGESRTVNSLHARCKHKKKNPDKSPQNKQTNKQVVQQVKKGIEIIGLLSVVLCVCVCDFL